MPANRIAAFALSVLVAALVIASLLTVGGPLTGRMERRDETRLADLRDLNSFVLCLARAEGNVLPQALVSSAACSTTVRLSDPYTGEPYRYERLSPASYRLCASFEMPDHLIVPAFFGSGEEFDLTGGCATLPYNDN